MRAYTQLFLSGWRRALRDRVGIATSLIANTVFGFVRSSLLMTAIAVAGAPVGGYDALTAVTYVWLGQGLLGVLPLWAHGLDIDQKIKNGDIAVDLLRPVGLINQWLITGLGRSAAMLAPRMLPMLLIGYVTTGLSLPTHWLPYVMFIPSLALAALIIYLAWILVALIGFWVIETRGFTTAYTIIAQLFTGLLVPVSWFPGVLRPIAEFSPFPSMFQTPINVAMGVQGPVWRLLLVQTFWVIALWLLAQVVLRQGLKKVVVQGG